MTANSKRKPLNLREYWDAVGTANMLLIIEELGSSLKYFRMMRYGIKRPSGSQALRIVELARKHTAPYEPDLELLLSGVPRAGTNPVKPLPPAPEFVRARKRLLKQSETQEGADDQDEGDYLEPVGSRASRALDRYFSKADQE